MHNNHAQLVPLMQWLTTLGVTVSDSGVSPTGVPQDINWWDSPLKQGSLRMLHEFMTVEPCTPGEQVQLALVLSNLEILDVKEIFLSPLAAGKDPRALRLLEGQVVTFGEFETTAGFALLALKMGKPFNPINGVLIKKWAQGKNKFTAYLFESADSEEEQIAVLQFQVDDMSPELLGYLQERALELGALDYFSTPLQMKKGRPGMLVTILTTPDTREEFIDLMFQETSTSGIRYHLESRAKSNRHSISVLTPYGRVRVKVNSWIDAKGKTYIQNSPEYEDCRQVAQTARIPLKKVYELALQQLNQAK